MPVRNVIPWEPEEYTEEDAKDLAFLLIQKRNGEALDWLTDVWTNRHDYEWRPITRMLIQGDAISVQKYTEDWIEEAINAFVQEILQDYRKWKNLSKQ